MQMRGSIEPGGFPPRPSSSVLNVNHYPPVYAPVFMPPPQQGNVSYPIMYEYYEPHHPVSALPPLEIEMERKYSGTLGSTYDYRPQLVYPNSEPFRKDLDRKLTTIEHEDLHEYQSRIIVRSSLPQDTHDTQQEQQPQDPICFNLCCIVLLVIGLVSLSLCLYVALTSIPKAAGGEGEGEINGGFLFFRHFNI